MLEVITSKKRQKIVCLHDIGSSKYDFVGLVRWLEANLAGAHADFEVFSVDWPFYEREMIDVGFNKVEGELVIAEALEERHQLHAMDYLVDYLHRFIHECVLPEVQEELEKK